MKAITLTQPWASLVAIGAKRIETRSWATSYRGPLAIHAGAGLGPVGGRRGLHALCAQEPFTSALIGAGYSAHLMPAWGLPLGAIVAVCRIVDCRPTRAPTSNTRIYQTPMGTWERVDDPEASFGDYTAGRYAWLLTAVSPLARPVPCRGALNLWTVPEEVTQHVMAALIGPK